MMTIFHNPIRVKLKALVLATLAILGGVAAAMLYAGPVTDTWDGTFEKPQDWKLGTKDEPILINNAEELAYVLAKYDNTTSVGTAYYKLTCDVDLNNINWSFPNFKGMVSFLGHFDGDGHTIRNINVSVLHSRLPQRLALFPALGGDANHKAEICNLHVENISFHHANAKDDMGDDLIIGGLVGTMYPNAEIRNCTVRGMKVINECSSLGRKNGKVSFISIGPLVGTYEPSPQIFTENYSSLEGQIHNSFGEIIYLEAGLWDQSITFHVDKQQGRITDKDAIGSTFDSNILSAQIIKDSETDYHVQLSDNSEKKHKYVWRLNREELKETGPRVSIPHSISDNMLSVEVLDGKKVIASRSVDIEAEPLHVVITNVKRSGNNYNITAAVLSKDKQDVSKDFSFSWHDMDRAHKVFGRSQTLTGADSTHCYHVVARHRRFPTCIIATFYSFHRPVYVAAHAITGEDAKRYTHNGKEYAEGNDANDGKSPETAVKTLKRAYELLKTEAEGGTSWNNMIVIMGDYDEAVFNTHHDQYQKKSNLKYFVKDKPATITGLYGNICNGRMKMISECNVIDAETRFESLVLHGSDDFDGDIFVLYAQDNNLTMGDGLKMEDYAAMPATRGFQPGINAPNISVFGGYYNNDNPDIRRRAHRVIFYSGHYGRIVAGDRSGRELPHTGNVSGSPENPIRSFVRIEIANNDNPKHYTHDVALLVGGQADGSCFATDTIEVNAPSHVGRVISGNLGYGREAHVIENGQTVTRPADSYFGQVIFNLYGGTISELYGSSLGRNGHSIHPDDELIDSCQTYFYGNIFLELHGGTVNGEVYGGGAGGVVGLGKDIHHTFDPHVPYLNQGRLTYGIYEQAKGKMPKISIDGKEIIDLSKSEIHVDIQNSALVRGSVYGGGYGYSAHLPTSYASSQGGSVFGDIFVQLKDKAVVEHNIFGGGRGTLIYYDNLDDAGYSRTASGIRLDRSNVSRLGCVYGKAWIDLSGGHVQESVYGAGRGVAYRANSENADINDVRQMAAIYGSANIHVSGDALFDEPIYGGGMAGSVFKTGELPEYEDGSAHIDIEGGRFRNAIYGGGNGLFSTGQNTTHKASADIEGDTWIYIRGGEFAWSDEKNFFETDRLYNIVGGGRRFSVVHGNTHIEAYRSLFSESFIREAGISHWDYSKLWNKQFSLMGGGYGSSAHVMGDTYVTLDVKDDIDEKAARHMYFGVSGRNKEFDSDEPRMIPHVSFIDVLGGGFTGAVHGSTHITMKGNTLVRNIYGGSVYGKVGLRDSLLNESDKLISTNTRPYTTGTYINVLSGLAYNVFGGGFMGDVTGETHVTIGSQTDAEANKRLFLASVYGGNDMSGKIAGSNNENYGVNLDIWGGTIRHSVYGAGNGHLSAMHIPTPFDTTTTIMTLFNPDAHEFALPHVACTRIRMAGIDENNRVMLEGSFFGGGNCASVGIFKRDSLFADNNFGAERQVPVPNRGRIYINLGSHVMMRSFFMGSDGKGLLKNIPYHKHAGKWIRGFRSNEDFQHYCSMIDFAGMPQLTFNADNSFHNNHPIIDFFGDRREFETPGEMDARDIDISVFFGGSNRGSMTSDSTYILTLPPGLTIHKSVTGGCNNAYLSYTETEGLDMGVKRERIGGFIPMNLNTPQYHRMQINVFNKFEPVTYKVNPQTGKTKFYGCNMYAGCFYRGIIYGASSINFHADIVGEDSNMSEEGPIFNASNWLNSDVGILYGGGYGDSTEVIGNTYISMTGARLNGAVCIPNLLDAFGGGMRGAVVGRTQVTYDGEVKGASPLLATRKGLWGKMFGGGRQGSIVSKSVLMPGHKAPAGTGTRVYVYSGIVDQVFGGARMADIEGGTYVEINDHSEYHFHTIVRKVYGGNDVAGYIGVGKVKPYLEDKHTRRNTFIRITEDPKADGSYTGFPFVGEVFAAGNGNYGPHLENYSRIRRSYEGGYLQTDRDSVLLTDKRRPHVDSAYVEVTGGSIMNLYGGGNNSVVDKDIVISVRYNDNNVSKRATFDNDLMTDCYQRGKWLAAMKSIRDGLVDNGHQIYAEDNIHRIFGGNNEMDMNVQPKWRLRKGNAGTVYGGCNVGSVIYYNEAADRNFHTGVGGIPGYTLNLNYPEFSAKNVFGGSRMGTVQASRMTYTPDGSRIEKIEPVTFASTQYGVTVNISNGNFGRVFGGNDITGTINNGTHIEISGGACDEIYGAGNGEYIYKVDSTVNKVTEMWDKENLQWYYLVPTIDSLGGDKPSDIEKIRVINRYRPNIAKSFIEIAGGMRRDMSRRMTYVFDAIYCGGNCSTILGPDGGQGKVRLDIGGQIVANKVFLGSNGVNLIKDEYAKKISQYNNLSGNPYATDRDGKTLLDRYMEAVTMYAFPEDFQFRRNYTDCFIGDFFLGGNRGSIRTHGDINITFPSSLTIFGKIVGGSNRGDITCPEITGGQNITHQGGIIWDGEGSQPNILLKINCLYKPQIMSKDADNKYYHLTPDVQGSSIVPVYSGCFESGIVEGSIDAEITDTNEGISISSETEEEKHSSEPQFFEIPM